MPQKIVAFRNAVATASADVVSEQPKPSLEHSKTAPLARAAPSPIHSSPKRTYLVCIDTLHSAFDNFARVRAALKKFFAEEQPGDSQYALIALGWSPHFVVDSTRDRAAILWTRAVYTVLWIFPETGEDATANSIRSPLKRKARASTPMRKTSIGLPRNSLFERPLLRSARRPSTWPGLRALTITAAESVFSRLG